MELLIDDHVKFSDEHNKLLTAQVLLTDAQVRTEKTVRELAEAQKRTDAEMKELRDGLNELKDRMSDLAERMNALISVVDGIIRKPPANWQTEPRP
ncbi:MAG: hypothetical protein ABSB35_19215 [Bryobacteraceae bacterium]